MGPTRESALLVHHSIILLLELLIPNALLEEQESLESKDNLVLSKIGEGTIEKTLIQEILMSEVLTININGVINTVNGMTVRIATVFVTMILTINGWINRLLRGMSVVFEGEREILTLQRRSATHRIRTIVHEMSGRLNGLIKILRFLNG
jgi:hypothetical protein